MRTISFRHGRGTLGWGRLAQAATWTTVLAAAALLAFGATHDPHAAEAVAYDTVYYTTLLSGRDADAAVRKAHFLTDTMMREFGMTRAEATAYVARSMVWRDGSLCGG
jgi:hypothetical protein